MHFLSSNFQFNFSNYFTPFHSSNGDSSIVRFLSEHFYHWVHFSFNFLQYLPTTLQFTPRVGLPFSGLLQLVILAFILLFTSFRFWFVYIFIIFLGIFLEFVFVCFLNRSINSVNHSANFLFFRSIRSFLLINSVNLTNRFPNFLFYS